MDECSTLESPRDYLTREWPRLSEVFVSRVFDRTLLISYAGRLVRLEIFLTLVPPEHCCVIEEERLVRDAEERIRDLARQYSETLLRPLVRESVCGYVHRMLEAHLADYPLDRESKRAILARLRKRDLSGLFEPGRRGSGMA